MASSNMLVITLTMVQAKVEGWRYQHLLTQVFVVLEAAVCLLGVIILQKPFHLPIEMNLTVLAITLIILARWGEGNFSKAKPKGPYAVGHKVIYVKDKYNAVSVFYPVDKQVYEESKEPFKVWLDHPDEWIDGLNDARTYYSRLKQKPSSFMFTHWKKIRVNAKESVPLAHAFQSGEKKLAPLIFSHGLTSNRCMHNVAGIEMASFGHIVFVIDHLDGSGSYTVDQKGKEVKFNTSTPREQFGPGMAG